MFRAPTLWLSREGNTGAQRYSRADVRPGVVKDPSTSRNNMHENRETSLASRHSRDRSGKANNHDPDMYAREESDC